jgi:hypothetical protein
MRTNHLLPGALSALFLAGSLPAQAPMIRIVPAEAREAEEEPGEVPENQAGAEQPADKGGDLAAKLQGLNFNRSPQAIAKATQQLREGDDPGPETAFHRAVLFGDWKTVERTLASLPVEKARPVYNKLINALAANAVAVGDILRNPERGNENESSFNSSNRQRQESREMREKPAPLLSEDFFGIIGAAPGGLTEDNIPAVAQLVKVAIGEGGRETLVAKIRPGWKGLGGDTPEGKILATRLLSALGWIRDAAPFLPLDEAEWDKADTVQLVHVMEYFTRLGIEERDERQLARAAQISARLMKSARIGNYTRPQFKLAMERLVVLLPALEPEAARELIREQLFTQKATLADIIAIFANQGQEAAAGDDLQARIAALGTQHRILEAIAPMKEDLPPNTVLLVLNWLAEAEGCYRAGGVVATELNQRDLMMIRRYGLDRNMNVETLSTEQVLSTAPPAELIARLNAGIAQRVKLTLLKLRVLSNESLDFAEVRAYAKQHPGLERQICQDILAAWVAKQTKPAEDPRIRQMRAYGMYIPPQMLRSGRQGIPLTRLRQNQNIAELRGLLKELREISPDPLDPALVVEAFMALHSGAEVYQLSDITAIFGPPEEMPKQELLALLEGMRTRLAEEWRDPQNQRKGPTNRTEKEVKDEVSRGYRTVLELARRGIPAEEKDWNALITRGRLFYDASQYEFERQIQLSDYVGLRDDAFGSFRLAALRYAEQLPAMPKGQWTIDPYQAWFFVMMGASDLAQLTSNPARSDPGLTNIGDAIRALPGEAADRHLVLFAEMLGEVFPKVPANVRQRFLNAGLKIVGEDHPAAGAATKSLAYYRELLDEIALRVTVDGPTETGHGAPFGVFISLETTRQLLRESGGFSQYLLAPGGGTRAMMGGGNQDLRGDFQKNIHEALEETFDIVSVIFHDASVKPIPLARDGWVETPMAYVVLRAKNPAVDRIPSIQIDMDFADQPGQVVLPVMSQVQPIDARAKDPAPRPCPNLEFLITLDEREWDKGTLAVEISSKGNGIIPDLGQCFGYERAGFDAEVVDGSLAVTELTSDGQGKSPKANRNWQITYKRKADYAGGPFILPQPLAAMPEAKLTYKVYRDTDLIELTPAEAAKGVALPGTGAGSKVWMVLGLILAILLALAILIPRRKKTLAVNASEISPPSEATPFATVAFLRRIKQTFAAKLGQDRSAELEAEIASIEARYFKRDATETPDLEPVIRKWLAATRG